jgi:hypothetical protein
MPKENSSGNYHITSLHKRKYSTTLSHYPKATILILLIALIREVTKTQILLDQYICNKKLQSLCMNTIEIRCNPKKHQASPQRSRSPALHNKNMWFGFHTEMKSAHFSIILDGLSSILLLSHL